VPVHNLEIGAIFPKSTNFEKFVLHSVKQDKTFQNQSQHMKLLCCRL